MYQGFECCGQDEWLRYVMVGVVVFFYVQFQIDVIWLLFDVEYFIVLDILVFFIVVYEVKLVVGKDDLFCDVLGLGGGDVLESCWYFEVCYFVCVQNQGVVDG